MSYAPRHARPVSRRRRALSSAAAVSVLAGGLALSPGQAGAATTVDPTCFQPKLADTMVSQGLPNYRRLVRGKSALVKLFLQVPGCAPAGTRIKITSGELRLTGAATSSLPLASLPLAELAPSSTAPIPSAQGDPLFLVPGDRLVPTAADAATVSFSALLTYSTTKADGSTSTGSMTVSQRVDGSPLAAVIEKASNPLRVLTVPMGDAGTFLLPNSATSQFNDADRAALTRGMTALGRVLPVADGVGAANGTTGGLRTTLSSGLLNVGPSMSGGQLCGTTANYSAIAKELNTARNNWNSANPTAPVDRAYGVISSRISRGGVTGDTSCADGYATVGGTVAWGRVIDAVPAAGNTPAKPAFTGAIAGMELLHTTGAVAEVDAARFDGAYHSFNKQADVTQPDRAWNVPDKTWLQSDTSGLNYQSNGTWNDVTSLLEKPDFDTLHCQLTPLAVGETNNCPAYGPVGRAGASLSLGSSFFLSGETNGTPGGTDAHTHIDEDTNYEQPYAPSTYRFVQRNAAGTVVANDGFRVTFDHSHHDGVAGPGHSDVGTFGTELQAHPDADRIELWRGAPETAGSVLLYSRDENEAPQYLGATVQGRTVTVSFRDEIPANVRLDVFYVCPGAVSPLANAIKPTATTPLGTGVITAVTDTSLGCANGRLRYRLVDGYRYTEQDDALNTATGAATATAAIYAPFDASLTNRKVIGLAGDGRDALGQPAATYEWTLQGPSFPTATPIATGASSFYVPPATGLVAGTYQLRLNAKAADGSTFATAVKPLLLELDTDGDGLADSREVGPCFPADAITDQQSAVLDYDFDGLDNGSDPFPCATANTAAAQFTSTSLNTGSNGNTVMLKLTNPTIDLRAVSRSDLAITQIGGHRLATPIPAMTYVADVATDAKATFDRQLLSQFVTTMKISGPTPIFVTAPAAGLRAGDAQAPNIF